jgi:histidinol-phosphate phosphatase family protein
MNKTRAVFLDRDGVINKKRNDYVKSWEEFVFLDGVNDALKILSNNGFKLIIITNQSAINRKILTVENLNLIHEKMKNLFVKNGIIIDAIFFCPHRPDEGCDCRKPKTGMIENAFQNFNLLPENCVLIGDSNSDIEAGKKMGIKSYLLDKCNLLDISKIIIGSE